MTDDGQIKRWAMRMTNMLVSLIPSDDRRAFYRDARRVLAEVFAVLNRAEVEECNRG